MSDVLTVPLSTTRKRFSFSYSYTTSSLQTTIHYQTKKERNSKDSRTLTSEALEYETKVKFQGLNHHPVFHMAKLEHKATPVPSEVTNIDFIRDPHLPDLAYGKIIYLLQPLFSTEISNFFQISLCYI